MKNLFHPSNCIGVLTGLLLAGTQAVATPTLPDPTACSEINTNLYSIPTAYGCRYNIDTAMTPGKPATYFQFHYGWTDPTHIFLHPSANKKNRFRHKQ